MFNKNGKINIFLIIVIVLVVLILGVGLFIEIMVFNDKKSDGLKKGDFKVEDVDNKKDSVTITSEVKKKLERFINAASIEDSITSDVVTATYFNKGVTSIDKNIKLKMVYNDLFRFGNPTSNHTLTQEEISNMDDTTGIVNDPTVVGENVIVLKMSDFDNTYKEFFKEDASYTINDLSSLGCPSAQGMSRKADSIYLFSRCGGTTVMSYNSSITSYEVDGDNYLVYQKCELYNNAENVVKESYNILWKFDKDLKFISTENV